MVEACLICSSHNEIREKTPEGLFFVSGLITIDFLSRLCYNNILREYVYKAALESYKKGGTIL